MSIAVLPGALLASLAGCGSLPSSGPSSARILSGGEKANKPGAYHMIRVTQDVVDSLRSSELASSDSGLGSLAAPQPAKPGSVATRTKGVHEMGAVGNQKIAVGDQVAVSIYTSGGGLFAPPDPTGATGNSQTNLPPQGVDASGAITIPHVGRINVVGRTLYEVEQQISEALKTKAIEPWVIVTIPARDGGDLITVTGDVKTPTRVPVPLSGLRLLDAIAAAGGSGSREYETMVSVTRGNTTRSDILGDILAKTSKNITLQPGDTVVLKERKWSYLTFGATGSQNRQPFDAAEMTLAEALAKAGGPNDNRANPEAMFVYRFESQATLKKLNKPTGLMTGSGVPVIYQVNLREPKGFFMASQFSIRDKDILFIGNAGSVGVMKTLGLVNAITAPARTSLSTAAGFETFAQ